MSHRTTALPPLSSILERKSCFILGAGASRDFTLPLWDELKPLLIDRIAKAPKSPNSNSLKSFWLDVLGNSSDDVTVDELAMDANNDDEFNFFQQKIEEILLEGEAKSHDPDNWASKLGRAVGEIFTGDMKNAPKYARNLSVVNLNYDRCFNHYYTKGIFESMMKRYKRQRITQGHYQLVQNEVENVIHPHGCIGQLNSERLIRCNVDGDYSKKEHYENIVPFGTSGTFGTNGLPPTIFPVDELHLPRLIESNVYKLANNIISKSEICICIGLSPLGISKSLLKLTGKDKIFYSGSETPISNFVPLNLHAKPLIEEILA